MDNVQAVLGFAGAALQGGAAGLRIEGADHVRAVCACHDVPVIGLIKRDLSHSPVRITPYLEDVKALSSAGAHIIAVDGTYLRIAGTHRSRSAASVTRQISAPPTPGS